DRTRIAKTDEDLACLVPGRAAGARRLGEVACRALVEVRNLYFAARVETDRLAVGRPERLRPVLAAANRRDLLGADRSNVQAGGSGRLVRAREDDALPVGRDARAAKEVFADRVAHLIAKAHGEAHQLSRRAGTRRLGDEEHSRRGRDRNSNRGADPERLA